MKKVKIIYIFVLWILFWISSSLMVGYFYFGSNFQSSQTVSLDSNNIISSIKSWLKSVCVWPTTGQYAKFDTVWNVLKDQYFDKEKLDKDKMIENSMKWFVDAIWDPYSVYFTAKENQSFQSDLKWEKDFEWIWAVVAKKEDWVMIEEVIKWSPAYKAWLRPLDVILEINWEKTKNMTVADAVSKIRGPKWTEVELMIYRANEKENVTKVKVARDKIVVPSVMWKVYNLTWNVNVGYVNISIIWEDTEKALSNWINENKNNKLSWIILDLRWNWGGYLPIAWEIVSHFVPKDKVVVTTKYRVYPAETYKSKGYGQLQWIPVIVMVDGLSASASEIIAAALKDTIGAKLLWTKTFGKGSIQTIFDLSNWASMKYTIGKWYTPNWENVDGKWIQPDISIEFDKKLYSEKEYDNQLEKAKEEMLNLIKK